MEYEDVIKIIQNELFCDPVKSTNLAGDLNTLKSEVIPALLNRIANLEAALQRESEERFKFKNSLGDL